MATNEEMREHMADGCTDRRTRSRGRKDGELAEGKGGENDRACYAHRCASGEEESKAPSMVAAATVEQVRIKDGVEINNAKLLIKMR